MCGLALLHIELIPSPNSLLQEIPERWLSENLFSLIGEL